MRVLSYNEFIQQNEPINEGFLNTLKTAIKKVVKDPKQYVNDNIENIQNNLEEKMLFKTKEFYEKNKNEIMEELKKLCNDDDLKKIYDYMKKQFNNFKKDEKKYNSKHRLSHFDHIWSAVRDSEDVASRDIIRKNLYKDASDAKCFAVLEIMYAFYHEYFKKKENAEMGKEEKAKKSGYRPSSDDGNAMFWGAVTAAVVANS